MRKQTVSSTAIHEQIEALRHRTVGQLKQKYREAFGEASRSNHKQFLFRRIAWRLQANAWGGLSERARLRALEIANDADEKHPHRSTLPFCPSEDPGRGPASGHTPKTRRMVLRAGRSATSPGLSPLRRSSSVMSQPVHCVF